MSTPSLLNVPNQLTIARLVLALILFVFLSLDSYRASLVVFILAAGTDWLDGFWARKYGQITVLGRILDPFADKMVVCGTFVFLAAVPLSGVRAWMAVVIVGRELLVTALRSFLEERGEDFSASVAGKWKMVLQCLAICFSLYLLSYGDLIHTASPWLTKGLFVLIWGVLFMTVYSGAGYIVAALKLLRK